MQSIYNGLDLKKSAIFSSFQRQEAIRLAEQVENELNSTAVGRIAADYLAELLADRSAR
jgi:hypothetical protein